MNILKYKYKAHKLINYAFYLVVFLIGFGIGFGAKKLDFSKVISQFLMIDNVSAITGRRSGNITYTDTSLNMTASNFNDEEYIYKIFNYVVEQAGLDISFSDFSNVFGFNKNKSNSTGYYYFSNSDWYYYSNNDNNKHARTMGDVFYIKYDPSSIGSQTFEFFYGTNDGSSYYSTNFSGGSKYYVFSTHDFTGETKFLKVLDFSEYTLKLEFNENLFKDNPDFKQVCVENNKVFAITRATNSEVNEYFDYDYIWFPFGLDGLAKGLYDSSLDDKFSYYTEQDTFGYYWFKNKENIDNYFNNDIPGLELEMKGYTNKYSYYGWSAHYFRMYFEGENTQFTIFKFVNPTTLTYNDETNTNHGGGGLRLDGDEEIQISNNYCFYVKNEYEVQYINVDEWEDYYGTVITPNGDYDFNTSHNKNNSNTDNFLSQPISFINSMKDTISFINSLIYELYISLPVLLRTFIITLLIILIIMLIMRIGGYK